MGKIGMGNGKVLFQCENIFSVQNISLSGHNLMAHDSVMKCIQ